MQNSAIGVSLGLASAATWGAGDFSGGFATKQTSAFGTVAMAHAIGLAIFLTSALARGDTMPSAIHLAWGAAAGVAGGLGLVALYRGLAVGTMGVVAPVSAVISAGLPVAFGMLTEGRPRPTQALGFVLALLAVWLVSQAGRSTSGSSGVGFGLLAGVGFGLFLVGIRHAGTESVLWALAAARVGSLVLMVALMRITRQEWRFGEARLSWIAAAGIFDAAGNLLFLIATHFGRLDVAAVLASLYPAITVALARVVLKERLSAVQNAGMLLALVAVPLIAWA